MKKERKTKMTIKMQLLFLITTKNLAQGRGQKQQSTCAAAEYKKKQ